MVVPVGVTPLLERPVTAPTPLLMASVVAPLTDHDRVEPWPTVMLEGVAEKPAMTGKDTEGDCPAPPVPHPPATPVIPSTNRNNDRRRITGLRSALG